MKSISIILSLFIVLFLNGCGGGATTTSNNDAQLDNNTTTTTTTSTTTSNTTSTNTIVATTYSSEISILKNSFKGTTEGWTYSYNGACSVTYNSLENKDTNGSIEVSNRSHNYDGATLNISSYLTAGELYVIRGYLKQKTNTTEYYKLNVKINYTTPVYKELNRVIVDNTNWNKLRTFVSFTQQEIDAGVYLYVNTVNNNYDYYLDEVEIAKASYDNSDYRYFIPRVAGNNIVDLNTNPIKIKGVNITAYDDEDSTTNDTSAYKFMNYSYYNYDKDDFAKIKSMGFNAIRINLWYRYFEDDSNPYVYKQSGFQWLDFILSWALENDLYIMLDLHAPQGGGFQGPNNITPFWSDQEYQNRFKALWKAIAGRYKNSKTIIAYDIINEPCANNQTEYITLLNETIDAIREVDSYHIINVENGFSSDATPFVLNKTNILYDFHFYDPWDSYTDDPSSVYGSNGIDKEYIRTLFEDFSDYYTSRYLPFNVSEFGQKYATYDTKNAQNWVSDTIDLINEKNGNYFYFSYKGNEFGIYDTKASFYENSNKNDSLIELLKSK